MATQLQDQTLKCKDCGKNFIFSVKDQEFFASKGFTNPPVRCRDCRNLRKKAGPGAPTESNLNKILYKITCKNCGKVGEMATEPRKPSDVLCSECFYDAFKGQIGEGEPAPTAAETEVVESEQTA